MESKTILLVPHVDEPPPCACTDGICDHEPGQDVRCKLRIAPPAEDPPNS